MSVLNEIGIEDEGFSDKDLLGYSHITFDVPFERVQELARELIRARKKIEDIRTCIQLTSQPFDSKNWANVGSWTSWKRAYIKHTIMED